MLFALLAFAVFSALEQRRSATNFRHTGVRKSARDLCRVWVVWGIVFSFYFRNSSALPREFSWLLKGSVLELLIAVPCHVIVRRRGDCSAPIATSFGIVTGIAVMLLSFGRACCCFIRSGWTPMQRKIGVEP